MPSDSVAAFLAFARRERLISGPVADELETDPGVPREGVGALCDALVSRGVLTDFQARQARAGQAPEFAGYAVLEDRGPGPLGRVLRAADPATGAPVELRRLSAADLLGESVADFLARAHAASELHHPHLTTVLDVGTADGDVFVALELDGGADLASLVADIGPMPAELAGRFVAHAAAGLAAAHAAGLAHGAVSASSIYVGPLDPMPDGRRRPAAGAVARLSGLGVTPRPPGAGATPAGDVRALGAALAHLLAGRPADPADLPALRPDLPPALAELIAATQSAAPPAAADFAALHPPPAPPADALGDLVDSALDAPAADPPPPPEPPPVFLAPAPEPSAFVPAEYTPAAADPDADAADPHLDLSNSPPPPPRPADPDEKSNVWLWVGAGVGLWAFAGLLWLVYIYGPFGKSPPPLPPARKTGR